MLEAIAKRLAPILEPLAAISDRRGTIGVALLRITLGVIFIVTWADNLEKDLYTPDGLEAFLDGLFDENGNDSAFAGYKTFIDAIIIPIAPFYAPFQGVIEFVLGIGLIVGVMTRALALAAAAFFFQLFLSYIGGQEWIWTYVLLFVAAVAVFLGHGGRKLGVDQLIVKARGEPKIDLLW